ncbi:MAG: hypothetical protein JXR48_01395 [Candidatus Delongbacteria bacterium]|nr:hypothetical protein [Candidatus Delongbacteria bacterium]
MTRFKADNEMKLLGAIKGYLRSNNLPWTNLETEFTTRINIYIKMNVVSTALSVLSKRCQET